MIDNGVTVFCRGEDDGTQSSNSGSYVITQGTRYYVDVSRDGTSFVTKIYDDEQRTSLKSTLTATIASQSGLEYFKTGSLPKSGGGTQNATYDLDNVKIYDGVTSLPDPPPIISGTDPLTVAGWYKKTAPFTDHFDTTKMTGSTIAPQTTGANAYPNTGDLSISPIWTITSGGTVSYTHLTLPTKA